MNNREFLATFYTIAEHQQWHSFHTPKNLATAVAVEAGELLAEFQWASEGSALNDQQITQVKDEMADVYLYLLVLADKLGVDLQQAVQQKSEKNRKRFLTDARTHRDNSGAGNIIGDKDSD